MSQSCKVQSHVLCSHLVGDHSRPWLEIPFSLRILKFFPSGQQMRQKIMEIFHPPLNHFELKGTHITSFHILIAKASYVALPTSKKDREIQSLAGQSLFYKKHEFFVISQSFCHTYLPHIQSLAKHVYFRFTFSFILVLAYHSHFHHPN